MLTPPPNVAAPSSFNIAIGPRIRKSPYFNSTVKAGVTHFTTYNHMYMPVSYGDLDAEYDRLINGVAMWDVAGERQVSIKGEDAVALARLITPRNLDNLVFGMGRYVPMCNGSGTLINDPVLLKVAEDEIWLSIADSDMKFWCEALAIGKGLNVTVTEPDVSPLAIQGPKAADLMKDIFGDWILGLKHFGFDKAELEGIPLLVAKSGWSKQGGYELYLRDGSKGDQLWAIIAEAGGKYDIGPGAPNYIERVESGLISIHADTDDATNPFEMGLGRFIDLGQDVECVGKAALKKIAVEGAKRRFCGIIMDGDKINSTNAHRLDIYQDNKYVGFASAAAYSPRLDKNIAVALITVAAADSDNLVVMADDAPRKGAAVPLPFKP
ncbi:MAG: glycine cleavage T C-terminal barrel domain-containing protein [Candidatus Puniceispirillales bacterium WSBS_2018_MAG_OTU23]